MTRIYKTYISVSPTPLVSMECMQTGVPTLTTPTLTPTTLRSIEESFIQLTTSAATDSTSFQHGLNSLVNTLNNSDSVATTSNDFTTANIAAMAAVAAAAKIPNASNTSNSATTTAANIGNAANGNNAPPPTRRGGGRRPTNATNITPEEEEKRRIRRERNKLAAARCRKRRVDQTNELTDEVAQLEKKREDLQKQIENLNGTKQELEFILEAHLPTCHKLRQNMLNVNTYVGGVSGGGSGGGGGGLSNNNNITGLDTTLASTARSISPIDLKPVLNDQLLTQIKPEPLDSALDSNSSLDQDGPSSPKRLLLSNHNPMIPPPLPNVATLSASLAAASASLNTPIVTTAPVSFGSMFTSNSSILNTSNTSKTSSKQRPNSLPTVPRNMAQNLALNVDGNKPPTDINGVAIQTPSTGMFNFDSLMDGGTGLTPVSGPLIPNCSTQNNKHPLELVTPTSEPSKILSL
uniref:BZIP domain-containing protein n=1 Tax=Glossina brevipalpis TaxID=37001 RepID=A0A1A9W6I6_9MUSC